MPEPDINTPAPAPVELETDWIGKLGTALAAYSGGWDAAAQFRAAHETGGAYQEAKAKELNASQQMKAQAGPVPGPGGLLYDPNVDSSAALDATGQSYDKAITGIDIAPMPTMAHGGMVRRYAEGGQVDFGDIVKQQAMKQAQNYFMRQLRDQFVKNIDLSFLRNFMSSQATTSSGGGVASAIPAASVAPASATGAAALAPTASAAGPAAGAAVPGATNMATGTAATAASTAPAWAMAAMAAVPIILSGLHQRQQAKETKKYADRIQNDPLEGGFQSDVINFLGTNAARAKRGDTEFYYQAPDEYADALKLLTSGRTLGSKGGTSWVAADYKDAGEAQKVISALKSATPEGLKKLSSQMQSNRQNTMGFGRGENDSTQMWRMNADLRNQTLEELSKAPDIASPVQKQAMAQAAAQPAIRQSAGTPAANAFQQFAQRYRGYA